MSETKTFQCKICCEHDEQGPCVLKVPEHSVNFNPHNCPFDKDCDAEWIAGDSPF